MKEQSDKMQRRTFLKISGASLAAWASGSLQLNWAQGADQASRNKPVNPVVLKSSDLEIVLDQKDGLPYEYHLLGSNARFRGEDYGTKITATVCDRGQWKFPVIPVTASKVKAMKDQ